LDLYAKCIVCGKTYIVCGSKQRYCPDCALEAIRRIDNAQSLAWEVEYAPPEKRKEIRHAAAVPITCVICGEQFIPTDGAKTCSQACSVALSRRRNKEFEASHREERRAYHNNRRKAKEAEMSPEEDAEYRAKINAKSRENYRKRQERKEVNNDD
jgi:predicted nucleic acid-binding Zn ribbon protein